MRYFDQPICQRCKSNPATRKSPYCSRCAKLHQEAEELTDRIMKWGQAGERYETHFLAHKDAYKTYDA